MSADTPAVQAFQDLLEPSKRPLAYSRLLELLGSSPDTLLTALQGLVQQDAQVACACHGLSALFELDSARATSLVQDEQLQEHLHKVAQSLLPAPHPLQPADSLRQGNQLAFASLLSTAASQQSARPLLQSLQAEAWLDAAASQSISSDLQVFSCTAMAKLLLSDTAKKPENYAKLNQLAQQLIGALPDLQATTQAFSTALEGLAILTPLPQVRKLLFESQVVQELCKPAALKTDGDSKSAASLPDLQRQFSLACIYSNITSYKPAISDAAADRLRQLAAQAEAEATEWEKDEVVQARAAYLIQGNIMQPLAMLVKSASLNARRKTGLTLANLTRCDKPERGLLLQQGAATMFLNLSRQEPTNQASAKSESNPDHLQAVQGLARLLITANPALVLTPPLQLESIHLLSTLFSAPEASLLAVFEALMALTNLCSLTEQSRSHFVKCRPDNMTSLDTVMLYDDSVSNGHMMCRRAATQLACNLTMCEVGFEQFAGDADLALSNAVMPPHKCQSRLHLLLALCDTEDLDTRMAASAALAMLTVSPKVCCFLLEKDEVKHRSLDIFGSLIQDTASPGLRQRGIACISNIIQRLGLFSTETQKRVATSRCQKALQCLTGEEASEAAPSLSKLANFA